MRALRLAAGARQRHGRRQHRQRLADRRLAPALIALGARGRTAQGRDDAQPAAGGLLPRLRQAGPRAAASIVAGARCRRGSSANAGLSRLQDLQALRRGHFRRDGARFRFELDGAPHRRRAHRLSAAWRRRRSAPRATEAALVGARSTIPRRWSAGARRLAPDFTPLTDMRATAAYRADGRRPTSCSKALIEIAGAAAPTRLGDLHAAE